MNITEVYGIEDDQILTQDIFEFEQTGVDENGKIVGDLQPTGERPTFMPKFAAERHRSLPPGEFGIPPEDRRAPRQGRGRQGPVHRHRRRARHASVGSTFGPGHGRTSRAAWSTSSAWAPWCRRPGRLVERLDQAQAPSAWRTSRRSWSARAPRSTRSCGPTGPCGTPSEFEPFQEEWVKWFPGTAPVGQGTLMPPAHRRAGFRVSLGVIAQT